MITPRAFGKIIRHFNEIDKAVSKRTTRKRPWPEIALTSLLCDLMDSETQIDEKLDYLIGDLQKDLNEEDGLLGINLNIETVQFPTKYERYLSQSDIGIKIVFENKIEPRYSWTQPYFLQAKRLIPNRSSPELYSESAKFGSVDKDQQKRIEIVNDFLQGDFIKYLMYCPRPEQLNENIRTKLAYLRNKSLSQNIFDYTKGLKLYSEFIENGDSIKPGMFVTDIGNSKLNFGEIHRNLISSVIPFSWFIAKNFSTNSFGEQFSSKDPRRPSNPDGRRIVNGILNGNSKCIEELINGIREKLDDEFPDSFPILPSHVLDIKVTIGPNLHENDILQIE